jgi:PAS domain S-box-containing protein
VTSPVILNVDDNEASLYVRSRILRRAGYVVEEARSGAEALARVEEMSPNLVLLDINLPDMRGYEVCRRIKASKTSGSVLVLHISATFAERAHRIIGLQQGADGYLAEPVEPEELIATVEAFLRLQSAEDALRESEEKYRTLMDSLADGVFVVQDGRFVFANPAFRAMTAVGDEQLPRLAYERVIAPESMPRWAELCRLSEEEGDERPVRREIRMLGGQDGTPLWTELRMRHIRYGRRPALLGIVRDITGRKRMEEMLRNRTEALLEQHRHKDEFLAMLAHELRNPLAPLVNALNILASKQADDDVRNLHAMMERQLGYLTRLVEDLLDVSRVARGTITLQLDPVDLIEALEQAIEATRPGIDARGHDLRIAFPDGPLTVRGDRSRLAQVFVNLLNNATKYTDSGGTITVCASEDKGFALVRVRDTGRGIAANLLPKVFDLFTQAERTLDRSEGGLGIGLTLVQRLVHAHGGEIQAHSAGAGQGSEFVVRIPLTERPERQAASSASRRAPAAKLKVIVVDDNADAAASLAMLLNAMGHDTQVAASGEEAIAKVAAFEPRLVLMDLAMPGMSGVEAASHLRLSYPAKTLTLIALTGYTDAEIEQLARDAGFDRVLMKPLAMHVLDEVLAAL